MNTKSMAVVAAILVWTAGPAFAQSDAPANSKAATPTPERGTGMQGGMHGHHHGMHGDHHGMRGGGMQGQGGMMHGHRFPPGYEKLEMQMHAEMMESMARILRKYAAQLPDPADR